VGAIAVIVGVSVMDVPAPILIALIVIFVRINGPATQLNVDFQRFVEALPAYEKILQLEAELAAARAAPALPSLDPPTGPIEFRDVTFTYGTLQGETAIEAGVHSLSILIEEGSVLGVTGPSGSGKTTFADLLVGLYPPQTGEISVGGTVLAGAAVPAWR